MVHGFETAGGFDEFGYFSRALKLKKNVDIFDYLDDTGIKTLPKVLYRSSEISEIGVFFFFFLDDIRCVRMY